jgi:hypothetical protein
MASPPPDPSASVAYSITIDADAVKKRIVVTLLVYGVAIVVGYYLIKLVFIA